MNQISIINKEQEILAQAEGKGQGVLVYNDAYQEGDRIRICGEKLPGFYWIQIDECVGKSLVYLTGILEYRIPFGEEKGNLSPKAFGGERHLITVRLAEEEEYRCRRNLAYNAVDQHGLTSSFPHASANVETRGESAFAAMNAIDGVIAPQSHGDWPYGSWGINQREDARWRLDFGRMVEIDKIIIFLRADFPHDNWWEEGTITFSDGSVMIVQLEKGGHAQKFTFPRKTVSWLEFHDLKKADDPSPFPALVQFEVYGTEREEI